jgi:NADPH:quinone reductase
MRHDPAGHSRNVELVVSWIRSGTIKPVLSEHVSLAETPAALERLTERKVTGKIVVLPEMSLRGRGSASLLLIVRHRHGC